MDNIASIEDMRGSLAKIFKISAEKAKTAFPDEQADAILKDLTHYRVYGQTVVDSFISSAGSAVGFFVFGTVSTISAAGASGYAVGAAIFFGAIMVLNGIVGLGAADKKQEARERLNARVKAVDTPAPQV